MATSEADAEGQLPKADALIGTTVGGRFHITERIARGGMACVYFATQQPLNRPVAIKVLRADGGAEDQESFRRRFLREANMLSQLQHPNIVTLLDYGQISDLPGDHYFMAMEYLRGETLAKRLRSRGALSVTETLRLARQVGRGLREAHRRGFVHRDLKPSNIMIVPEDAQNDIVKLVDFGIGKVIGEPNTELDAKDEEEMTRVGLLLGSPRHMAPEQIRGELIEPRTDLYGLGVILFQALSGQLPFDGRNEVEILVAHCTSPAPKLTEAYPDRFVPESLSNLVDSLLKKQASARPTIYEFLLKLADVEDEVFGALGMPGATQSFPPPPPRASFVAPPEPTTDRRTVSDQQPAAELALLLGARDTSRFSESFVRPLGAPPRRKRWLGIAVGLLLMSCIAIAVLFWKESAAPSKAIMGPSAAVAPIEAPAKPDSSSFVLSIDSTPSKATVMEDGIVLGKTPLTVVVERSDLARSPRRLSLEHDGYEPYALEQHDSPTDVNVLAPLKAKPTPVAPVASAVSAVHPPGVRTEPAKAQALPTSYATGATLEIRTRR